MSRARRGAADLNRLENVEQAARARALARPHHANRYATLRASPLQTVTNTDDLDTAPREGRGPLRVTNPDITEEHDQRKDSKVEPTKDKKDEADSGGSDKTQLPIPPRDETQEQEGYGSSSDETIRPGLTRQEEAVGDDSSDDGTASPDDLLDATYPLERSLTDSQVEWSDTIPRSTLEDDGELPANLVSDFGRLDGDWTGPSGLPMEQAGLTEANLETLLDQIAQERRGDGPSVPTRLGPSGEAPGPGYWFGRQPSAQVDEGRQSRITEARPPEPSEEAPDEGISFVSQDVGEGPSGASRQEPREEELDEGVSFIEDVGEGPSGPTKSEPQDKAPDEGIWFGSGRSPSSSSSHTATSKSKRSIKIVEPAESSLTKTRRPTKQFATGGQSEGVARKVVNTFGKATKQLAEHHRQQKRDRRVASAEAQKRALENARSLQAQLREDSEEDDDNAPRSEFGVIGDDLDFERQSFREKRRGKQRESSSSRESPSSESTREQQPSHQTSSESREERQSQQVSDDNFPSMEEVWRRVGLDASVDSLMRSGQWSMMEAQWASLRGFDVMWEFKARWDAWLEGGDVKYADFLDVWTRAIHAMAGRNDSAMQQMQQQPMQRAPDPEPEPEVEENIDYRNENPYLGGESVYLEHDFRDAVVRAPGIAPDTNEWTRRFFETHVFYWQQLVDRTSTTPLEPPPDLPSPPESPPSPESEDDDPNRYGPGDRKGKKPEYRALRGGFDTFLYRAYRRKRHARPLIPRRRRRGVRSCKHSAMNNYFNPGDMANSVPRQAPSPGPQHQTNGIGGNSMANLNNSVLPAGQQADMNHLWGIVEQLSQVLAENRTQTAGIVDSVQQIQVRPSSHSQNSPETLEKPSTLFLAPCSPSTAVPRRGQRHLAHHRLSQPRAPKLRGHQPTPQRKHRAPGQQHARPTALEPHARTDAAPTRARLAPALARLAPRPPHAARDAAGHAHPPTAPTLRARPRPCADGAARPLPEAARGRAPAESRAAPRAPEVAGRPRPGEPVGPLGAARDRRAGRSPQGARPARSLEGGESRVEGVGGLGGAGG